MEPDTGNDAGYPGAETQGGAGMNQVQSRRMIRLSEVCDMVGLKRTTVYAKIKTKSFPAPIKIGYASRWIESEVLKWIEDQITKTRGAGGNCWDTRS
jgi:prophage regulatory protein